MISLKIRENFKSIFVRHGRKCSLTKKYSKKNKATIGCLIFLPKKKKQVNYHIKCKRKNNCKIKRKEKEKNEF